MRIKFLLFSLFFFQLGFSQEITSSDTIKKQTYCRLYISSPLLYAQDSEDDLFLFDGLNARIGFGKKLAKWISIGGNLGFDWKASQHVVVTPVFVNLNLSVKISKEDRLRTFIDPGYGKAFAIGRGDLSGTFKRLSLGIQDDKGFSLYIEFCGYGFYKNGINETGSFSVGFSLPLD